VSRRGNQISKIKEQKYKSKIKYSCRRQRGITDAGLILFGGRFLDCAAMLSKESAAAALEMTRVEIASVRMTPYSARG
jgi:succinate dehydrogenase flavin-adding protein (antitoxin of CptAB toxin-antitoxin module)